MVLKVWAGEPWRVSESQGFCEVKIFSPYYLRSTVEFSRDQIVCDSVFMLSANGMYALGWKTFSVLIANSINSNQFK